jgi:hypothetical protein
MKKLHRAKMDNNPNECEDNSDRAENHSSNTVKYVYIEVSVGQNLGYIAYLLGYARAAASSSIP